MVKVHWYYSQAKCIRTPRMLVNAQTPARDYTRKGRLQYLGMLSPAPSPQKSQFQLLPLSFQLPQHAISAVLSHIFAPVCFCTFCTGAPPLSIPPSAPAAPVARPLYAVWVLFDSWSRALDFEDVFGIAVALAVAVGAQAVEPVLVVPVAAYAFPVADFQGVGCAFSPLG